MTKRTKATARAMRKGKPPPRAPTPRKKAAAKIHFRLVLSRQDVEDLRLALDETMRFADQIGARLTMINLAAAMQALHADVASSGDSWRQIPAT